MNATRSIYHGFCFPAEIISHAVFVYHRFYLSLRDVEELLAARGVIVSYETIRRWCRRFGPLYARRLRKCFRAADHWHMDEVFMTIRDERHYLWRAVDEDGDLIESCCRAAATAELPSVSSSNCSKANSDHRID